MVKIINKSFLEVDISGLPDPSELVGVPNGYWKTLGEADPGTPEARVRNEIALQDNGEALGRLVTRSLEVAEETLDLDPGDYDDPEIQMKVMSMRKDMAQSIINAGLKADENRFRRKNEDVILNLLARIEADKKVLTIENQPSRLEPASL
jgi:hypothetical protein